MADKSLNRTELVAAVAADSGQSQAAVNGVLDALFATLSKTVKEGTKVTIPGWLAVERTHRSARSGRNPQTGEPIQIAASYGVKISAGSKLKAAAK
jgi:DNA-binding protein HU-beta